MYSSNYDPYREEQRLRFFSYDRDCSRPFLKGREVNSLHGAANSLTVPRRFAASAISYSRMIWFARATFVLPASRLGATVDRSRYGGVRGTNDHAQPCSLGRAPGRRPSRLRRFGAQGLGTDASRGLPGAVTRAAGRAPGGTLEKVYRNCGLKPKAAGTLREPVTKPSLRRPWVG